MELTPIPGFEQYKVSREGDIWSTKTSKWLKPSKAGKGYLTVTLNASKQYVHRMVGRAYLGLTEDMQINHVNGDKTNNWVYNLEVVSGKENVRKAWETGLYKFRDIAQKKQSFASLTLTQIERLRSRGRSMREIGKRLGMSEKRVRYALTELL